MVEQNKLGEYKKAESSNVVKFEKEGDFIEGVFIELEESKMYEKSYALKFIDKETKENRVIFVNNIVFDLIKTNRVIAGNEILLRYLGKQKTQDGKFEYKNYELFYK